jgi:membrane protein
MLARIYLGAITTVICAEFNAVRVGQLWPRSLLTPFTDDAELTPADKRAYISYARTERHKSFENIDVSFGNSPQPRPAKPEPWNITSADDTPAQAADIGPVRYSNVAEP